MYMYIYTYAYKLTEDKLRCPIIPRADVCYICLPFHLPQQKVYTYNIYIYMCRHRYIRIYIYVCIDIYI